MVYLHVPFCESFCTYCGFFSVALCHPEASLCHPEAQPKDLFIQDYCSAVLQEIESRREEIVRTTDVNTLYIGGGTPSVLPLDVLSRIVHSLEITTSPAGAVPPNPSRSALRPVSPAASHPFMRPRAATGSAGTPLPADNVILRPAPKPALSLSKGLPKGEAKNLPGWTEFTIEVNPEDIVTKGEEYVRGLMSLGVNRISMGVQSFDDGILRWMNRRHDSAEAIEAFRLLRRCGVGNISIDLIFGLPQLDESTWISTIEKALALAPEHISAYQLSIEEGSALYDMVESGRFTEADEEQCRRQYDLLCERLGKSGYHHYEVSNFALPGYEAVHNSAYWRRVPYVGLGPGAHSLSFRVGNSDKSVSDSLRCQSIRSWNSQELPRRMRGGVLETYSREGEILSPEDIRVERIMLPLRTDAGLPESELRSLAGDVPVDRLLAERALVPCPPEPVILRPALSLPKGAAKDLEGRSEGSLRIPEDHFFVSDDIIRELI